MHFCRWSCRRQAEAIVVEVRSLPLATNSPERNPALLIHLRTLLLSWWLGSRKKGNLVKDTTGTT